MRKNGSCESHQSTHDIMHVDRRWVYWAPSTPRRMASPIWQGVKALAKHGCGLHDELPTQRAEVVVKHPSWRVPGAVNWGIRNQYNHHKAVPCWLVLSGPGTMGTVGKVGIVGTALDDTKHTLSKRISMCHEGCADFIDMIEHRCC